MTKSKIFFDELNYMCKFDKDTTKPAKDDVSKVLSHCHNFIKSAHKNGMGGQFICSANSLVVDKLIIHLYERFIQRRKNLSSTITSNFCIVALGGYGRSQLCPKSDIDLLFMYSSPVSDEVKTIIVDEIAYPLWDSGYNASHSSRTFREAIADSKEDFILRNSMIDARFVCGNARLFANFEVKFKAFCQHRKKEHFNELMRLKRDRHSKYGWSAYIQEPNIKNGVGGLRDAQTMAWKTFLNFGINNIRELATRSIISIYEYKSIVKAYNFLLRVRNDMHYHFDRPIEILDLATQVKIAQNLDFNAEDETTAVEEFMRKVYYSFKAIDNVSKVSRKRMKLILPSDVIATMRHMGNRLPLGKKFYSDGFLFYNGEVNTLRRNIFKKNPNLLIKIFELCQLYASAPSDKLEVLIKDSTSLIDKSVRNNRDTNNTFLNILQNKGNVFPTLELMHFWGVLGAFVPEFENITCMVQHEFYHYFTADVHTLNTIAHLDKIFCTTDKNSIYWEYHKVLLSTPSPILVYLMLFLHDIGKGDGIKGHAEVGAEIGKIILKRMKVPDSDIEPILFVIKNHLQMARFWQSNDIEDEASIINFANIVKTEDQLKYLYVLTFCDAMGTADGFWNSYKQGLHNKLYTGTLSYLKTKSPNVYLKRQKNRIIEEALQDKRSKGLEDIVIAQAENLPSNYFAFHGRNDLLMHVKMINALKQSKAKNLPILEWHDEPNMSVSRLYVASMQDSTLFSTLVGVITLSGFDILGSKIFKCANGINLDAFYIHSNSDGIANNDIIKSRFSAKLESALLEKIDIDKLVDEMFYLNNNKKPYHISNVSVRKESKKIILEIAALDRIGLLYKIAKLIDACGYNIVFARIISEQFWANDTFQLEPRENALPQATLLKRLKQTF